MHKDTYILAHQILFSMHAGARTFLSSIDLTSVEVNHSGQRMPDNWFLILARKYPNQLEWSLEKIAQLAVSTGLYGNQLVFEDETEIKESFKKRLLLIRKAFCSLNVFAQYPLKIDKRKPVNCLTKKGYDITGELLYELQKPIAENDQDLINRISKFLIIKPPKSKSEKTKQDIVRQLWVLANSLPR